MRNREYISQGSVKILPGFLGVPKVISVDERGIRDVCDATKYGLNEAA